MEEPTNLDAINQNELQDMAGAALLSTALNVSLGESNNTIQAETEGFVRAKTRPVISWKERIEAITTECWARGFRR